MDSETSDIIIYKTKQNKTGLIIIQCYRQPITDPSRNNYLWFTCKYTEQSSEEVRYTTNPTIFKQVELFTQMAEDLNNVD